MSLRLHVNVDHVATLRQARRETFPDPVAWSQRALAAGAHGITCHLRKDRRHIQDADVPALRAVTPLLNLESSLDEEMLALALKSEADQLCLVPENRNEITTEGGLDVISEAERVGAAIERLREVGQVSLFIDPDVRQIDAAAELGAPAIELHTGAYAIAEDKSRELARLASAVRHARGLGLIVHAGHGLDHDNVAAVAALDGIDELNIGFALVARAVFDGVEESVRALLAAMQR